MHSVRSWLPSATELRVITAKHRRRARGDEAAATISSVRSQPDSDLRALIDEPFETVDDTYERLDSVERHFRRHNDRRAVFLTVYTEMTGAIRRKLGTGFFTDPDWVADYLVTFANHYRMALLAFERDQPPEVPQPWHLAFQAAQTGDTLVLQDALLGVNAHINYDLPYALREVGIEPHSEAKRVDHNRINRIIKRIVDTVQSALVTVYAAKGVGSLDAALERVDEYLALIGLTESRTVAWHHAERLTPRSWPFLTAVARWRLMAFATGCAHLILDLDVAEPLLAALDAAEQAAPPVTDFEREFRRQLP